MSSLIRSPIFFFCANPESEYYFLSRTVLNGHFQVHTNDLLMFYWGDEVELFEENGGRKNRSIMTNGAADVSFDKVAQWVQNDLIEKEKAGVPLTGTVQVTIRKLMSVSNPISRN